MTSGVACSTIRATLLSLTCAAGWVFGTVGATAADCVLAASCPAAEDANVDVVQRGRALLKFGLDLQHHAVLIGLSEDGGNQPLAEGVVQRVVDGRGRYAEPARGIAVDLHIGLQAAVLQVAGDVGELWNLPQPIHQPGHPEAQLVGVGILDAELVLRAAHPVLDGQILHRLHVERDALHLRELLLQAADHRSRVDAAFRQRLQVDQHAPAVQRRVDAVHTDERRQARDSRILQHHARQRLLALAPSRRTRSTAAPPKSPGSPPYPAPGRSPWAPGCRARTVSSKGADGDQQRGALAVQHPVEHHTVARDHVVEERAHAAVEPALLGHGRVAQQLRAHHRRERERDDRRDQDRHRQRDCELAKQPSRPRRP